MNQEQNNASSDATTNNQQSFHEENQKIKEFYLRYFQTMYPALVKDKTDDEQLISLKQRTSELIDMLSLFDHSWAEEISPIQKACFSYLGTESLPRKERQKIINAWVSWSDFLFRLSSYHGLLYHFLQYNHRILEAIEIVLNKADETSSEAQKITEEGGI